MAFTCADIEELCWTACDSVIYLAIGCAKNAEQQCPPFLLRQFPEKTQLLIWVDPELEETPAALLPCGDHTVIPAIDTGIITWIPIRESWDWSAPGVQRMMRRICSRVCQMKSFMIVQDFTGTDIRPFYPVADVPNVLQNVIYDVNNTDGACNPPMATACVIRDGPKGMLIQAPYMSLSAMRAAGLPVAPHVATRAHIMYFWIWRLLRHLLHAEAPTEWCTPENAVQYIRALFHAYGDYASEPPDLSRLERVTHMWLEDVVTIGESDAPPPPPILSDEFGKWVYGLTKVSEPEADPQP